MILSQGKLIYAVTGIYPAQDFFSINADSGEISVTKDLKTDSLRSTTYNVSMM